MKSLLLLLACVMTAVTGFSVEVRRATPGDISVARKILLQEKMNPLSISEQTLLVASNNDNEMMGFGQIRPLDDEFCELASLYVFPQYRNQGVGRKLVSGLLQQHDDDDPRVVCLLTLKQTMAFYEKHGFQKMDNVPPPLQFEFKAGSLLSLVLGNDLVCMVRECNESKQ